jgi:hypothetical protein
MKHHDGLGSGVDPEYPTAVLNSGTGAVLIC